MKVESERKLACLFIEIFFYIYFHVDLRGIYLAYVFHRRRSHSNVDRYRVSSIRVEELFIQLRRNADEA